MLRPIVAVLGAALVVGQAEAQSLAAAAEKEKERRAKQQQSKTEGGKSYDDGALASGTGTLANDPSLPPAVTSTGKPASGRGSTLGTRAGASSSGSSTSGGGTSSVWPSSGPSATSGEAYWRARAQQLRSAVATAEAKVKRMEREASLGGPMAPGQRSAPCQEGATPLRGEGSIALRERSKTNNCAGERAFDEAVRKAQNELPAARQELDQAKRELAALDDDARRAGALPGWIR
jgi:hypothetical protein